MADNKSKSESPKEINWQDFNYPPLLKIIHFSPSELPPENKQVVLLLFGSHLLIVLIGILNFIDNCVQTSQGLGGIRIFYSVLFILLFSPATLFLFYRAYTGLCKQKSLLGLYMYLQPIFIILWIVFGIVDFLGFNGFIRVSDLFKLGYGGAGALALIQSLLFMLDALLSSYLYYRVCQLRNSLRDKLITSIV